MYKLYEKVPKSKENLYGQREIKESENPFLEGPCLLCISAGGISMNRNVFGTTKEGIKMARMRVRGQKNAGFDLKDFPVKFLSLKYDTIGEEKNTTEKEKIDAFVNQYLQSLIANNGQKIDCIQAMKNMRNINIMSYCDGTKLVQNIEENLTEKMQKLGYTDEEIRNIQSQMCMFPIATYRLAGMQKSTCISFKDIHDTEVNDNVTKEENDLVEQSIIGEDIFKYSENEMAYLFSGDGTHSLSKYTSDGIAMPVCLSSAISKALENSILNSSGKDFVPITARTTYI